ncbi:LysR family transcriptional regulator [Alloscardovia theropitheci]|uniref:LysR family transcriptional regulator n=1 Tax=Alloscardovia theropitheci TaxID=2496842 RepID=A0A4R0QWT6_9BIFI|nr:LysR family transcriptional regulator [Alloscardovia theropitheci]TCD53980.1 LysR family transcriptional regulator [Alloscardovia theropitheci]
MNINSLRNFMEVAQEKNITAASEIIGISQPALSNQIKQLEAELGQKLLIRHARSISLTPEGLLFQERAADILSLVDKTTHEFRNLQSDANPELRLGCAESAQMSYISDSLAKLRGSYPHFQFHITSGDSKAVLDLVDRGLIDCAVVVDTPELNKYNSLQLPGADRWVAIMKDDDPLARKASISINDLIDRNVIASAQSIKVDIPRWAGADASRLNFVGTSNLMYNAARCVESGLGILLAFEHLVGNGIKHKLCSRPLNPPLSNSMHVVWRKNSTTTEIFNSFLTILQSLHA